MQKNQWSSAGLSAMLLQFSLFISKLIQLRKFTFAHNICLSIQVQLLSGLNEILNAKLAKCHCSVFNQAQPKH